MPVENIMSDVVTAERGSSIKELAETMESEGIGDVVIAEDDRPVGIVTDRDVALAVAKHDDLGGIDADHLMTEDPVTIDRDAEAIELPKAMAEGKVRRIPVVDDDGNLAGIATLDDVVATIGEEMEDVATVIEAQSPGYSPD